jgi:oligosaccharide repeat unit polymerase
MATVPFSPRMHLAATRGFRFTALLVAVIILAVLFPGLHFEAHLNWTFSAGLFLAGIILLSAPLRGRNPDLFNPACLFPAAYCIWFAAGSLDVVPEVYQFSLFDPIPLRMWGYYALGLAGYWLGIRGGGQTVVAMPEGERLRRTWDSRRFGFAMTGLILMGTAMYLYLVSRAGIPVLRDDWAESRVEIGLQNGIVFTAFLSALWTAIPMLFAFLWIEERSRALRWEVYALVGVLALMLFSMGSRGLVFIPALIVVIVRHYLVRPWKLASLLAGGSAVFAFIGVVGYLRDYQVSNSLESFGFAPWVVPLAPAYLYVRAPVATLRDVSALISERNIFQHGALFLSPFAVLAPGHHLSSDLFFKALLRHNFVGFGEPATLLGVFYGDFGVPGVFFGMAAVGLLARWSYGAMRCRRSPLTTLLFSYYAYVMLFSLFGTLFPYLITLWIPLMFVAVDRFARRSVAASESATCPT